MEATKNLNRVASFLTRIKLSKKEKEMIYQHFGHSEQNRVFTVASNRPAAVADPELTKSVCQPKSK